MKIKALQFWMVWRYLKERRRFLSLNVALSVLGMSLGVAALVAAMAIVSGFESTLKQVSVDSFGDLILARRGGTLSLDEDFHGKLEVFGSKIRAWTPFLQTEAIFVSKGKIAGVVVEGLESATVGEVLSLQKHIRDGEFNLKQEPGEPAPALIGKELRRKMGLQVGDVFRLVIPVTDKWSGDRFRPRSLKLKVQGVLSVGRHDIDERYVLIGLPTLQKFTGLPDRVSGIRLRTYDSDGAQKLGEALVAHFGFPYWMKTWRDANRNLFEAIQYEKPVIFIIVCLIVIAAAFNISTSLYVSVLRRYRDISVLKTLGATPRFIRQLFVAQGLLICSAASVIGVLLGLGLCAFIVWIQNHIPLFPGEIYRIDHVDLDVRAFDLFLILSVSLLIGYVSTWSPALRGSKLRPVEGLRYE